MAKRPGGIDYSKWDNLDLSSSDEEEEEERVATPAAAAAAAAAAAPPPPARSAATMASSTSSRSPLSGLKLGDFVKKDDVIGGQNVIKSEKLGITFTENGGPDGGPAITLNDPSKVHRTEDGRLIVGDLNGEHFVLGRAPAPAAAAAAATASRGGGEPCYHGSTAEHFEASSDYQRAVVELVDRVVVDMEEIRANNNQSGNNNAREEGHTPLDVNMRLILDKYAHVSDNEEKAKALCRHAFAWAATEFLAEQGNGEHWRVISAAGFGSFLKYVQIPGEFGSGMTATGQKQSQKFMEKMATFRGTIVSLSKHVPCKCFDGLLSTSKFGTKVAPCAGCHLDFPFDELKICQRCSVARYCSRECQVADWKIHKKSCKKKNP